MDTIPSSRLERYHPCGQPYIRQLSIDEESTNNSFSLPFWQANIGWSNVKKRKKKSAGKDEQISWGEDKHNENETWSWDVDMQLNPSRC